jgi:hypothetical protein
MDGYSVKDAALVLGIPERRVWELIARGVLSSSKEGPDGMRVFLQPRVAAEASVPEPRIYRADEPDPAPRPNGNGGSHEMSPFRELLTEFRSLTERYGQALLALGEARGEVASLRSRVELLEARMDLRLPGTRPASTVAWEIPGFMPSDEPLSTEPEATAEVAPDFESPAEDATAEAELPEELVFEAAPEPMEPVEAAADLEATVSEEAEEQPAAEPSPSRKRRAESRRRKIKGGRSALVGIADALARAEDPTPAELPGAEEAAEAMAALQAEVDAGRLEPEPAVESSAAEASEPAAELELEPMEEEGPEVFTEASMPAISVPTAGLVADADESTGAEAAYEADAEAALPDVIEVSYVTLAEADEGTESTPVDALESEAGITEPEVPEAIAEPAIEAPEGTHELLAAPDSPYSADVIEPDWFADGDFTWLEAAQAEAAQAATEQVEATAEPAAEQQAVGEQLLEPAPTLEDTEPAPSDGEGASTGEAESLASSPDAVAEPQPVQGADVFEPSVHDEVRAEEEARAAIQDAFQEAAPETETLASVSFEPEPYAEPMHPDGGVATAEEAIQEAFTEPVVEPEPEPEFAPATAAEVTQEAFVEPMAEPEAAQPAEEQEAFVEPVAEQEAAAAEPEEAIQEAFAEPVAEAEPVAPAEDAIQEAFTEPATEPEAVAAAEEAFYEAPTEAAAEPEAVSRAEDGTKEAFIEEATEPQPEEPPLQPPPFEDVGRAEVAESADVGVAQAADETPAPTAPTAEDAQAPATEGAAGTAAAPSGEEELMWLGDEFEEASIEVAAQGWRSADAPVQSAQQPPALELTDAELSQLAEDEGWDVEEVEAIRRLLGRPTAPEPSASETGAEETPNTTEASATSSVTPAETDLPPQPRPMPRHAMSSMSDPQWLRGRRGPAATAYRRLRRLFPG